MKPKIKAVSIGVDVFPPYSPGENATLVRNVTFSRWDDQRGADRKISNFHSSYHSRPTFCSLRRARRAQSALIKKYAESS